MILYANTRSFLLFTILFFSTSANAAMTLNLLTWEGYAPDAQVAVFTKLIKEKYNEDITLNVTYVSSSDQYFTSIRNKSADIIAPSHNIIKDERYKLISQNLILPIDLNNIPNYSKVLPSLQNAEYATTDNKVYSVPLVHGPYGLAYNADAIPAPTSWTALWDPKNSGKYAVSSDYFEVNIYITALALGISPEKLTDVHALNSPTLQKKLKDLVTNANNLWVGVDSAEDLKNNVMAAAWGFSFPDLLKQGQTWKMAEPKEGTTSWVDGHAISKTLADKPKLKKIAEEWINFTISDDFQLNAIVRGIGSAPVNTTIKSQLTKEEIATLHLDDPDYFKNNRILWPTLNTRQRNLFKLMWETANTKN